MIKFCAECGATKKVWDRAQGLDVCRCGSTDVRPLEDDLIHIEFQSLIESAFDPFTRHYLEALALTIEPKP